MDDYYSENQPELIHCKNCGEDYAATYRACPFCNTTPDGRKVRSSSARNSRAGNRVRTNTRGGGYGGARSPLSVVGIVLSIILVVAAIVIVIVLLRSAFSGSGSGNAAGSGVTSSQGDTSGSDVSQVDEVVAPDTLAMSQPEAALNEGESITLTAAVTPDTWSGQIIWASSDGAVANVDQMGVVTYVGAGTCTITATAAGVPVSCTVTCNAPAEPVAPEAPAASDIVVTAYGNTMDGDFTINVGESIPFKAEGGDGANYAWSIADTGIATVDGAGACVGVAAGKTTMTVTSGEMSTTVTIRVKGA